MRDGVAEGFAAAGLRACEMRGGGGRGVAAGCTGASRRAVAGGGGVGSGPAARAVYTKRLIVSRDKSKNNTKMRQFHSENAVYQCMLQFKLSSIERTFFFSLYM
jgi:hypothetical protein